MFNDNTNIYSSWEKQKKNTPQFLTYIFQCSNTGSFIYLTVRKDKKKRLLKVKSTDFPLQLSDVHLNWWELSPLASDWWRAYLTSTRESKETAEMTCGLPDLHNWGYADGPHDLWLTWPPWWRVRRRQTWPVAGTGTERAAGESWPGHPPTDAERH